MSTRIYTNITALSAAASIHRTLAAIARSTERLSTGLRINSAADDPAGLARAVAMRTQIDGLAQAEANANSAVSMLQTAESALSEIGSLLQSMRNLALHASNVVGTDAEAAQASQAEIEEAIASLDSIVGSASFGTVKLLDGTVGTSYTSAFPDYITGAWGYTGSACSGLATVQVTQAAAFAGETGDLEYLGTSSTVNAGTVIINGIAVGNFESTDSVQNVIDAINSKVASTGVTAALSSGTSGFIALTHTEYGSAETIEYVDTASIFASSGATNFTASGDDAEGEITFYGGATVALESGSGLILSSAGGTFKVGLTASATQHTYGGAIITSMGTASFQIGPNAGDTESVSIDSVASHRLGTTVDPTGVYGIDVTTEAGAQEAISVLDEAISQISTVRTRLGAFERHTLGPRLNVLASSSLNLQSALSDLQDVDIASETVLLTRNQVILEAGIAVLAQANLIPATLLGLLS